MGTGITILLVFIAVVVTLLIAVPVTRKIAVDNKIKQDAEKIGTAEEKARNIIDEALKTAETKKREALLEAKEESLRTKNEVEKETRERRAELQKYEKRVLSKEESVDKKADVLERRENEIGKNFRFYLRGSKRVSVKICGRRSKNRHSKALQRAGEQSKRGSRPQGKRVCGNSYSEMCCRSRIREYHLRGTASER